MINAIELNNVTFGYNKDRKILKDLSLNVEKGSIYGYLGKNGAGKSTTIKLLLQLLKPTSGSIQLFEEPVFNIEMFKRIGALIESPSFYAHLNLYNNLKIYCYYRKLTFSRINEVCELVNLDANSNKKCGKYSTGMKQRLSLAIALLDNPELLILDEPINGIDPSGVIEFRDLLLTINRNFGTTIFFSSHQLSEVEKISTHIGIVNKGQLVLQGRIDDILKETDCQKEVYFETSDVSKSMDVLMSNGFTTLKNNKLRVKYQSKEIYASNLKLLSDNAIDIFDIQLERSSIEDIYIKYTNV